MATTYRHNIEESHLRNANRRMKGSGRTRLHEALTGYSNAERRAWIECDVAPWDRPSKDGIYPLVSVLQRFSNDKYTQRKKDDLTPPDWWAKIYPNKTANDYARDTLARRAEDIELDILAIEIALAKTDLSQWKPEHLARLREAIPNSIEELDEIGPLLLNCAPLRGEFTHEGRTFNLASWLVLNQRYEAARWWMDHTPSIDPQDPKQPGFLSAVLTRWPELRMYAKHHALPIVSKALEMGASLARPTIPESALKAPSIPELGMRGALRGLPANTLWGQAQNIKDESLLALLSQQKDLTDEARMEGFISVLTSATRRFTSVDEVNSYLADLHAALPASCANPKLWARQRSKILGHYLDLVEKFPASEFPLIEKLPGLLKKLGADFKRTEEGDARRFISFVSGALGQLPAPAILDLLGPFATADHGIPQYLTGEEWFSSTAQALASQLIDQSSFFSHRPEKTLAVLAGYLEQNPDCKLSAHASKKITAKVFGTIAPSALGWTQMEKMLSLLEGAGLQLDGTEVGLIAKRWSGGRSYSSDPEATPIHDSAEVCLGLARWAVGRAIPVDDGKLFCIPDFTIAKREVFSEPGASQSGYREITTWNEEVLRSVHVQLFGMILAATPGDLNVRPQGVLTPLAQACSGRHASDEAWQHQEALMNALLARGADPYAEAPGRDGVAAAEKLAADHPLWSARRRQQAEALDERITDGAGKPRLRM